VSRPQGELFPTKEAPALGSLRELAAEARSCRACPLYANATQTVFGAGPDSARVVLVGEQPGDKEDLAGAPFVGPAGALLDELMEEAGLDRRSVYVTNAVKHFKWEPRGKARIHKKPNAREIAACRPWLDAELQAIRPEAVVLLGATAAQAMLGSGARIGREAGRVIPAPFAPYVLVTLHPAAVLRAPDVESRLAGRKRLVKDLAAVAARLRTKDGA